MVDGEHPGVVKLEIFEKSEGIASGDNVRDANGVCTCCMCLLKSLEIVGLLSISTMHCGVAAACHEARYPLVPDKYPDALAFSLVLVLSGATEDGENEKICTSRTDFAKAPSGPVATRSLN